MKNHLQLNPIIADFKKGRHYFGDIQYKALYFTYPPQKHDLAKLIFEAVPSTLSSILYPRQLAIIVAITKSCRFCVR